MKLLVDTQILSFLYFKPSLIKSSVKTALHEAEGLYVSAISLIEIAIKEQKYPGSFAQGAEAFLNAVQGDDFYLLDIKANIAPVLQNLPSHHRDPFDRILIAQAICENLTIVSTDQKFPLYPVQLLKN